MQSSLTLPLLVASGLMIGLLASTGVAAAEGFDPKPTDENVEGVDDTAPTEETASSPATLKAKRKALRLARLNTALDDYESRYTGWHLNPGHRWFHLRLSAELGFVGVLSHRIQFGQEGSTVDYLEEGGQDNLFPFARLSVDFEFAHHLVVTFLYQPLNLKSTSVFQRDIRVDDTVFPAGTPMQMRYGFDFYRLSIGGDFLPHPEREMLLGFSAQIRNATIDFTSADGALGTTNRDIGFVPILKARFRWTFEKNWFLGAEVDGWFASGRGVSGSSNDFDAAIIDASIRGGVVIRPVGDVFVNLRYIGGGATGTDETPEPPSDGYTNNWFHTLALSLGVQVR
jgi:hypothetical protein